MAEKKTEGAGEKPDIGAAAIQNMQHLHDARARVAALGYEVPEMPDSYGPHSGVTPEQRVVDFENWVAAIDALKARRKEEFASPEARASTDNAVIYEYLSWSGSFAREYLQRAQKNLERVEIAKEIERQRRSRLADEQSHWFRRFFTSLAIANGAAFAALASNLKENPENLAERRRHLGGKLRGRIGGGLARRR